METYFGKPSVPQRIRAALPTPKRLTQYHSDSELYADDHESSNYDDIVHHRLPASPQAWTAQLEDTTSKRIHKKLPKPLPKLRKGSLDTSHENVYNDIVVQSQLKGGKRKRPKPPPKPSGFSKSHEDIYDDVIVCRMKARDHGKNINIQNKPAPLPRSASTLSSATQKDTVPNEELKPSEKLKMKPTPHPQSDPTKEPSVRHTTCLKPLASLSQDPASSESLIEEPAMENPYDDLVVFGVKGKHAPQKPVPPPKPKHFILSHEDIYDDIVVQRMKANGKKKRGKRPMPLPKLKPDPIEVSQEDIYDDIVVQRMRGSKSVPNSEDLYSDASSLKPLSAPIGHRLKKSRSYEHAYEALGHRYLHNLEERYERLTSHSQEPEEPADLKIYSNSVPQAYEQPLSASSTCLSPIVVVGSYDGEHTVEYAYPEHNRRPIRHTEPKRYKYDYTSPGVSLIACKHSSSSPDLSTHGVFSRLQHDHPFQQANTKTATARDARFTSSDYDYIESDITRSLNPKSPQSYEIPVGTTPPQRPTKHPLMTISARKHSDSGPEFSSTGGESLQYDYAYQHSMSQRTSQDSCRQRPTTPADDRDYDYIEDSALFEISLSSKSAQGYETPAASTSNSHPHTSQCNVESHAVHKPQGYEIPQSKTESSSSNQHKFGTRLDPSSSNANAHNFEDPETAPCTQGHLYDTALHSENETEPTDEKSPQKKNPLSPRSHFSLPGRSKFDPLPNLTQSDNSDSGEEYASVIIYENINPELEGSEDGYENLEHTRVKALDIPKQIRQRTFRIVRGPEKKRLHQKVKHRKTASRPSSMTSADGENTASVHNDGPGTDWEVISQQDLKAAYPCDSDDDYDTIPFGKSREVFDMLLDASGIHCTQAPRRHSLTSTESSVELQCSVSGTRESILDTVMFEQLREAIYRDLKEYKDAGIIKVRPRSQIAREIMQLTVNAPTVPPPLPSTVRPRAKPVTRIDRILNQRLLRSLRRTASMSSVIV